MKVFIIPKNLSINVIESQLLERALNLADKKIILVGDNTLIDTIKTSLNKRFKSLSFASFNDLNKINKQDIDWIYVREFQDFFYFYIKRLLSMALYEIHYDFRGIISEESYLRNKSTFRKMILNFLEKFIFLKSNKVYCVSEKMKSYFLKKYGSNRDIEVVPCCVPSDFCILKTDPSSHREMRFIYVGSMSKWQSFEKVCELYSSINTKLKTLTVITKDTVTANQILTKHMIEAKVMSGDKKVILEQLDQADFGFIFRTKCKVNTTASPIKFLEYTARGVIPVMSQYVGVILQPHDKRRTDALFVRTHFFNDSVVFIYGCHQSRYVRFVNGEHDFPITAQIHDNLLLVIFIHLIPF